MPTNTRLFCLSSPVVGTFAGRTWPNLSASEDYAYTAINVPILTPTPTLAAHRRKSGDKRWLQTWLMAEQTPEEVVGTS